MNDFTFAPSPIQGYGVYANVLIEKGDKFEVRFTWLNGGDDQVFWNNSFDGRYPEIPFCFLNHSDDPNMAMCVDDNDVLYLEALRDIEPREELTIDYGPDYDWQHED